MNILVIASGSRGDVQPYIALGLGLQAAGHAVRMLTNQDFEPLVTSYGLAFVPMGGHAQTLAANHAKDIVERGNLLQMITTTGRGARQLAHEAAVRGLAASQQTDLLIGGLGGLSMGLSLAEKLGIPFVQAYLVPLSATRAFASVLLPVPQTPLTSWANRLSHRLTQQLVWQMFRAADQHARTQVLGLQPAPLWGPRDLFDRSKELILYGYSPQVVPSAPDWKPSIQVTGYWFLAEPAGWTPPQNLIDFLASGPPPVYIGFGSMPSRDPQATAKLALEALARAGQRGVLYGGWGGMQQDDLPPSVCMTESVPHSWLFPRMAAVVHHGGAGTTAAGLVAGVPSVITPFFGDQPFWGRRVAALGVGPTPIPRRRLTAEQLGDAITKAVADTAMRSRAAELGQRIRAEAGVACAVAAIEQHFAALA